MLDFILSKDHRTDTKQDSTLTKEGKTKVCFHLELFHLRLQLLHLSLKLLHLLTAVAALGFICLHTHTHTVSPLFLGGNIKILG